MMQPSRNRRLLPLIIASAVAFVALDAAGFGPFTAVRKTVLSVGQPIRVVLSAAVAPVGDVWDGAVHYDEVVEENSELRRRIADLEGRVAGQGDAETDLRDLLTATEIDYIGDTQQVTARVIADRRTNVERIVEVDKGADDGIARGMPVVTGLGLVGTVEVVTGDRSTIRLITDGEVAVGVRSENGLGLALGSREATMELLASPELAESIRLGAIVNGERFVTSGIDRSVFPAGIPVGRLKLGVPTAAGPGLPDDETRPNADTGPDRDPAGPVVGPNRINHETLETITASIEPFADIDRLGYLTVLLIDPDA